MRLQSSRWPGLQSLQSPTGLEDDASHGCWQEALVPCHVALAIGPLGCPHHTAASFTQNACPRESKAKATCLL